MKKLFLLPLAAMLMAVAAITVQTYNVDVANSKVAWKGYKVTGEHSGTINLKSGALDITDGKLTGGSFVIDMTSLKDTDMQGEMAGKLEGHLKSPDFFGTEKYPTAKFVITKAYAIDTKGNYKVIGDLTIKETTKEVKFQTNLVEKDGQVSATGKIVIDRSDFDVKYGSGSFFDGLGDKTIYDEFDLTVTLVAKK